MVKYSSKGLGQMTALGAGYREADIKTTWRYLRQREGGLAGFWPWGLVPLLAFFLLILFAWLPFAQNWVESRAETSARVALDAAGESWAKVEASGQWVTLTGEAPNAESAARAIALVSDVRSRTAFGLARPVTRVTDMITYQTLEIAPPDIIPEPVEAMPIAPGWMFEIDEQTLVLKGEIAGPQTRASLTRAAQAALPAAGFTTMRDELTLIEGEAVDGYQAAALRGIETISLCKYGYTAFQNQTFEIDCDLASANEPAFDRLMATPLTLGVEGETDIRRERTLEACDARFARVLADTKFQFESGSAAIGSQNDRLLDDLVVAIGTCSGELVVEGHTDSTGAPAVNLGLSQARAEVVRMAFVERGLSPDRIRATGFGSARPLGNNSTPEGRAQNRRIEIHMRPGADGE